MSMIINCDKEKKEELIKRIRRHEKIENTRETEGICYIIDDSVFKVYHEDYNAEGPICRDDLYLESFIFPSEIYMYKQKVFAYKTPYIKKNYLGFKSLSKGWNPDIKVFKKALDQLIFDTYVLSRNYVKAIDFSYRNTLYDGEKFYIIDTLDYQKVDEDILSENIESLKSIISCFIADYSIAYELNSFPKDENALMEVKDLKNYIDCKVEELQEIYGKKDDKKMRG